MPVLRVVFVLLMLLVTLPAVAERIQFLSTIPELPLPQGAYENYEGATMFDTPDGRFIEVELYLGGDNTTGVISYYQDLLPSLGWQKISQGEFYKGNESLKISSSDSVENNRITILLEPR